MQFTGDGVYPANITAQNADGSVDLKQTKEVVKFLYTNRMMLVGRMNSHLLHIHNLISKYLQIRISILLDLNVQQD